MSSQHYLNIMLLVSVYHSLNCSFDTMIFFGSIKLWCFGTLPIFHFALSCTEISICKNELIRYPLTLFSTVFPFCFREPTILMFFGLNSMNVHVLIAIDRARSTMTTIVQRKFFLSSDFSVNFSLKRKIVQEQGSLGCYSELSTFRHKNRNSTAMRCKKFPRFHKMVQNSHGKKRRKS